jgi:hypothetical protein
MKTDQSPSTFTELFSNNPDSRLFDVFIIGREFDYPMTDLSNITGINRQRLKKKIAFCLGKKLIIKTRKMSGMQLYQWNMADPLAKALVEVSDQSMFKNTKVKHGR